MQAYICIAIPRALPRDYASLALCEVTRLMRELRLGHPLFCATRTGLQRGDDEIKSGAGFAQVGALQVCPVKRTAVAVSLLGRPLHGGVVGAASAARTAMIGASRDRVSTPTPVIPNSEW